VTAPAPLSPEAWRRVNDVFHEALDRPADERQAFVDHACADAPDVRAEVHSLLAAHARAAEFIERPAGSVSGLLPVEPDQSLVGCQLGHYRVTRVLGEGGMGVVYLAQDERLGRVVALKALAPRFTDDEARRERLRREARAVAALSHPGIATVYALEEIDGHVFIAGEFVPGHTLRVELEQGPLGARRTIDAAIEIADALAAAHERGVIHRDLKPDNVIRATDGHLKILDFGLARLLDLPEGAAQLTADGTFLGTPAYMSPEQVRGGAVDGRSDLFALGIVLYELASGIHPFAGRNHGATLARILEDAPARLSELASHQSAPGRDDAPEDRAALAGLDAFVTRCLQKPPEARFASAREAVHALRALRDGLPLPAPRGESRRAFSESTGTSAARWWWQFHQAAASISYCLLLIPLWLARAGIPGRPGVLLFVTGVGAVIAAVTLRLHLWFTVKSYPAEWALQRAHSRPWLTLADTIFVFVLAAGGLAIAGEDETTATVLVASAVATLVSFTIIEPATTRAAFGRGPSL